LSEFNLVIKVRMIVLRPQPVTAAKRISMTQLAGGGEAGDVRRGNGRAGLFDRPLAVDGVEEAGEAAGETRRALSGASFLDAVT
jgi:hypothetical protein